MLELCRERGLTLATAESCTGGLVAARLTSVPGSSDVFLGGDRRLRERGQGGGAGRARRRCSPSTAPSRPRRPRRWPPARARGSAPTSRVSVTGVAGPGGGTQEKPVGLVYIHAEAPDGGRGSEFSSPATATRSARRATVAALHLVRRLLSQSRAQYGRDLAG